MPDVDKCFDISLPLIRKRVARSLDKIIGSEKESNYFPAEESDDKIRPEKSKTKGEGDGSKRNEV